MEQVFSSRTYPKEYAGPKAVRLQIEYWGKEGYDTSFAEKYVAALTVLPTGAEGWFAFPKVSAFCKKHGIDMHNISMRYAAAVKKNFEILLKTYSFLNYGEEQFSAQTLRQHERTEEFMRRVEERQEGDIVIVPAQFGMSYRGRSVYKARELFTDNEFGLGCFSIICMALLHPERFMNASALDVDCAGDEFSPGADGVFSEVPRMLVFFHVNVGLNICARDVSAASMLYGSASAFLSQ